MNKERILAIIEELKTMTKIAIESDPKCENPETAAALELTSAINRLQVAADRLK